MNFVLKIYKSKTNKVALLWLSTRTNMPGTIGDRVAKMVWPLKGKGILYKN